MVAKLYVGHDLLRIMPSPYPPPPTLSVHVAAPLSWEDRAHPCEVVEDYRLIFRLERMDGLAAIYYLDVKATFRR